jgi:hypothetical protein
MAAGLGMILDPEFQRRSDLLEIYRIKILSHDSMGSSFSVMSMFYRMNSKLLTERLLVHYRSPARRSHQQQQLKLLVSQILLFSNDFCNFSRTSIFVCCSGLLSCNDMDVLAPFQKPDPLTFFELGLQPFTRAKGHHLRVEYARVRYPWKSLGR